MAILPDKLIAPMLAATSEPFDSKDFLFEIKWDGTRCVAYIDHDDTKYPQPLRLINRREILMNERYPDLMNLAALPSGTILDCEIIVLENGRPNFNKLQQRDQTQSPTRAAILAKTLPATLMAFDLLFDRGENIMNLPLATRHERLAALIAEANKQGMTNLVYSQAIPEKGAAFFEEIERQGMEGIMAKRVTSKYQPGARSEDWLKIKVSDSMTLTVLGFVKRDGEDVVSSLVLADKRDDGSWRYRGKVGSGLTEVQRAGFYQVLNSAATDEWPSGVKRDEPPKDAVWSTANMQIRVKYFEQTDSGKLRSPVFVDLVK